MIQNAILSDPTIESESKSIYAKTDVTELVEIFRSMAQDNQKSVDELTKLHRNMYNSIIQKQNDELENYRRGALKQSIVHVLRSVAEIYNENNQDFDTVENPISLLKYIISQLKELLQDNDVQIIQSNPDTPFDRKFMKTQERFTTITDEPAKDRTVIESIKPGYTFYGEPLLQEFVSVRKFVPDSNACVDDEKANVEINCAILEEGKEHTPDDNNETVIIDTIANESATVLDEINVIYNDVSHDTQNHSKESEEINHG